MSRPVRADGLPAAIGRAGTAGRHAPRADPGLGVVGEQQGVQGLPGERGRQRNQCRVPATVRARLTQSNCQIGVGAWRAAACSCARAAIQQVALQVIGPEVFAIAIHATIAGPYQRAVGVARADHQGVHAACAEAVEAEIGADPEIAFAIDDDRHRRGGGQPVRRIEALHAHGLGAGEGDAGDAAVRAHRGPQRTVGGELQARGDQRRQPPRFTLGVR